MHFIKLCRLNRKIEGRFLRVEISNMDTIVTYAFDAALT